MKIIEKIVDANTNEETITERDATPQEIAEAEWSEQTALRIEQERAQAESKKVAAVTKLAALGLTEDDLKAIL